jgi:adenylylsulfate kinase-like enzyme
MNDAKTVNKISTEARAHGAHWRERPLVLVGLMGAGKSTIGRRNNGPALARAAHTPSAGRY